MAQSIRIKIAGQEYPLMVEGPDQEQLMRIAAETINQKLALYDAKFRDRPLSDKLAFVALNETVTRLKYQNSLGAAEKEASKLQESLENYLEDVQKK